MSRRQNHVSPLSIVLPAPMLPRRRSSLLSGQSSAPQTPRSGCNSPSCASWVLNPSNRKSTDSWNSSNNDFGDDGEVVEWKPDHILLLTRTLDALPSHLVTPFHGPIPPSNLLDKIARGIAQAKGPVEWPFSLRATRVKLIEIARSRSKDAHLGENNEGLGPSRKRTLQRQSSMDFIHEDIIEEQHDTESINRLSNRLQRQADSVPTSNYRPQRSRGSARLALKQSASPSRGGLSPSTPSTSTLASLSSFARSHHRRSGSTLSSMTSNESMAENKIPFELLPSSMTSAPDPRVQRVRRSESFCSTSRDPPPSPPTTRIPKRAPSYGALAQENKHASRARAANDGKPVRGDSPDPSSDEEERARAKSAKKARTRTGAVASPASPSPISAPGQKQKKRKDSRSPKETRTSGRMIPENNPSIFGPELSSIPTVGSLSRSPGLSEELLTRSPPSPRKTPALRRVKRMGLGGPSRRISFGSLADAASLGSSSQDTHLASAFQLR
ncbi:hypothetical protein CYLTODRAFT_430604 [Cylindrobasidium torrendii FP15055 ss-10]|uniref:Uncharacterized protein n=1 Tax=Cylindrobasidium torrendii FP15055 ss-10 TaxID=1314674 RepID=A0A0D7BHF4_9AGAR|nr:hypothetical protein CYLTODRAFT_430604 [Cylindrobasidium torrendii FP15055 ss-10]